MLGADLPEGSITFIVDGEIIAMSTEDLYRLARTVATSVEFWRMLALIATHEQRPCRHCGAIHGIVLQ